MKGKVSQSPYTLHVSNSLKNLDLYEFEIRKHGKCIIRHTGFTSQLAATQFALQVLQRAQEQEPCQKK